MAASKFVQTYSIIRRLKTVMFAIAVFFVIGFFGNYFASQGSLKGLQEINNSNAIQNHLSQALEGLDSSILSVEKVRSAKQLRDIQFAFDQSQLLVKKAMGQALLHSGKNNRVLRYLNGASQAINNFEQSAEGIFDNHLYLAADDLEGELLVARQFSLEAREALKDAQISLRQSSNSLFAAIYQRRFIPLIVTIVLSIFFFTFVVTYGFSLAKKLGLSIGNLLRATDYVSRGNLTYEAKILEHDELGNLTNAFNLMVERLNRGRIELDHSIDRIKRLQEITAAFSEALTVEQVCDVTVGIGMKAIGARAGAVGIISGEGTELELRKSEGLSATVTQLWQSIPLDTRIPMTEAVGRHEAVFVEDRKGFDSYPAVLSTVEQEGIRSSVSLPLIVGNSCLGGVSFSFTTERRFTQDERDFLIAIARQSAQALHRSQLYDDAKIAIESRDEFLSIASHELKTPLTPLKLQLQMLGRQIKKGELTYRPEKLASIVESSDRQLSRLSRLVEDLLDVSRITSGRLTLNLERIDMEDLLREVLSQYSHQLRDALKVVEVTADKNVVGEFDKVRLEQVLINLLTNAAKYAPGKPIKVSLENRDPMVRICVRDQGPGVAPENQKRIFDRFERVRETDNVGGLGLGLYISQQIVKAHNGHIYVRSNPGHGATFVVDLPLHQLQ